MRGKMIGNEYRSTVVCIDSYKNHVLEGRFYSPFYSEGKHFNSMIEYMMGMEELLDEMQFPQPFTNCRTFFDTGPIQTSEAEEKLPPLGKLATFQVRVIFRQNASWQGSVVWLEGHREESFRSVLELILLMNSALSANQ